LPQTGVRLQLNGAAWELKANWAALRRHFVGPVAHRPERRAAL